MSGCHEGLAALNTADVPLSLYTHCTAHRVNLVTEHVGTNILEWQQTLGNVQEMYTIIEASSKRSAIFNDFQEKRLKRLREEELISLSHQTRMKSVKNQAQTRWACHVDAATNLRDTYDDIIDTLDVIANSVDSKPDRAKISCHRAQP